MSSVVLQGVQGYYPVSPDARNFPQAANGGVKSSQFNNRHVGRSQYPNTHHTNPNHHTLSNNQTWKIGSSQNNSQSGSSRQFLNSNGGNGNLNAQSQNHASKYQTPNYSPRRQGQSARPHVRLPAISTSTENEAQQSTHLDRSCIQTSFSDPKSRSTQNKDSQSKPSNSLPHHKPSTSDSSKTSVVSLAEPSVVSASPASTQYSSPESSTQSSLRQIPRQFPTPTDIDQEWLLLRTASLNTPSQVQKDKYWHVHPLVRKYASETIPEVKMGEPKWANAVMSRRWQREETLEQEKKEILSKREGGELTSRPVTCMTVQQDRASRLAEQTLAMLKELDNLDMERNQQNSNKSISEEERQGSSTL